jgi:capsid protein
MLDYELRPGLKLELEKGEDAKFLESTTPSANWLEFSKELIRLILAAKRIPYSLWDSKGATYSAQRGDFNRYKISCREEQAANKAAYREACEHILSWGFATGDLELPPGVTDVEDLRFELVPRGTFILDTTKESAAIQQQVAGGHLTNEDACHQLGTGDFYEIQQRLAAEQKFQRSLGIQVVLGIPGQPVSTDRPVDEETEAPEEENDSGAKKKEPNE